MTHPTLGYTNFRFDGDDAVHMAAFNGAGHVIACNAEGPTEHDLWPHGVDAPVDCENCLRAREADWWMAQAEQQRREGAEAVWPESTSEELHNVAARVMSQVDAKMETTILWGDGDNAPPITVETSHDYHFAQDKMAIRARQGDVKLARYLARSPLSHLASDAGKSGATPEILIGPASMRDVTGVDLTPEERLIPSVRDYTNCDRCNYDTHRCPGCGEPLTHGTEACAECNARIEEENVLPSDPDGRTELPAAPSDVDTLPEPANWCHVHNRTTEAGREECSECLDERGEDRKAGES